MTRVLMVLGPSSGGIGIHVRDLVEALGDDGLDVQVVAHPASAEHLGIDSMREEWPDLRRPRQARSAVAGIAARADDADVVHAHGFQAGFVAELVARRQRQSGGRATPFVVSLHNQVRGRRLSPRRVVGTIVARRVLADAALVTGASSDLVADALALGARRAELAEVPSPRVPDLLAVDRDAWRTEHRRALLQLHGVDPTHELVLAIGRVSPQKQLDVFVAASTRPQPEGRAWVLVGPGQEALTDPGEVGLVGAADDISPWVLAADVLVVPSEWEARALVVQEAMAAGTPVVATDVGGLPDLLTGVGTLLEPAPHDTLAARLGCAVGDVLGHPLRASALAEAARERAAGWDDSAASARRWRLRYASVLR